MYVERESYVSSYVFNESEYILTIQRTKLIDVRSEPTPTLSTRLTRTKNTLLRTSLEEYALQQKQCWKQYIQVANGIAILSLSSHNYVLQHSSKPINVGYLAINDCTLTCRPLSIVLDRHGLPKSSVVGMIDVTSNYLNLQRVCDKNMCLIKWHKPGNEYR